LMCGFVHAVNPAWFVGRILIPHDRSRWSCGGRDRLTQSEDV
jgi:hypothetical protein